MRIVVAGGTGFIGEPLVRRLSNGNDVAVLTRTPAHVRAGRALKWDPPEHDVWADVVAAADVVINLAGENIAQRWSAERKARIVSSRLDSTNALIDAMRSAPPRARTFINASAVGYYGSRGDEMLDESSAQGSGFLADVVMRWEAVAQQAESIARLVILRFGVVLDRDGGALRKMLPPFLLGAGGRVGNGNQWLSWIHRDDVVGLIEWIVANESARGIYNAVTPEPVRNREFTRALSRAVRRPAILPVPAFALRLVFGEMADETLLASQRVVSSRASDEGFSFEHREVEEALRHSLTHD